MTLEQVVEMGGDTKLLLLLNDYITALKAVVKSHVLDDLGADFLNT